MWQYHKYIGYGETIARFGQIRGIDDFCRKAQVVNYEQYRALQELQTLADAYLQLKIKKNDGRESVATIKNIGSETAFFIRLKVWNATTNQIVLPVFFSDNYFTLI